MGESGQSGLSRRTFMPAVGISEALNMTLAGVVAHQSALNDGKWMDIPKYEL